MIGGEGDTGGHAKRDDPLEVVRADAHRAGPDDSLIFKEISRHSANRDIVARRQMRGWRVRQRSAARHRLEAKPLTEFVPRDAAWDWLVEQWTAVGTGPAHLALVTGEPGIGKSRLVHEFAELISREGGTVLTLYCSRAATLSPLHPFGPVMGSAPATPEDAVAWVEDRSKREPLLLIVEDAHWADPSTLEAVEMVARRRHPVLVLVSARPEMVDDPSMELAAKFVVERMTTAEAHELLESLSASESLSAETCRLLVARADGVPLFLEELVHSIADGGVDFRDSMPATISEVMAARLDRLGPDKRVAQAASVIGRTFESSTLQAVTALSDGDLAAALQRLIDLAIVEPRVHASEGMQFRHALLHEATYRSVIRSERIRAHAVVGDAYAASGRYENRPEVVASHLSAAGRAVEAVPLWRAAARNARHNARFRESASHERELLALVPHLPEDDRDRTELSARGRLVLCLTAADQNHPDALVESQRVESLALRLDDRAALLRNYMVLITWWQANAEYAVINDVLVRARAEAEALGDEWSLQVITMFECTVGFWQGSHTTGLERMREFYKDLGIPLDATLENLETTRSVELMAVAAPRAATALSSWLSGRTAEAWHTAGDALEVARGRSVPQAVAVVAVTTAIMAQLDGDRALVAKLCAEAWDVADEVSTRQWRQWARSLLWWAGEGVEEPETPGPLLRPYFLMLLADHEDMEPERAMSLLADALQTARRTGERFCESEILRVRARWFARVGEVESALLDLLDAETIAREQGAILLELKALTQRAQLPGAASTVRQALEDCVSRVAAGGPSLSLDEARRTTERV